MKIERFNSNSDDNSFPAYFPPMAQFSVENAGEMARRAVQVREARKDAAKQATIAAFVSPEDADKFRDRRLSRVRLQLNLTDSAIEKELAKRSIDASQLDRLASAAIRLNEQERQLSNRSLPPTLKADAPRKPKRSTGSIEPEPE